MGDESNWKGTLGNGEESGMGPTPVLGLTTASRS